jgi:hypothetical protein
MNVTRISIYCLPNIRAPWVLVYEPHPWNHGALRVKESSAVLVFERLPTKYEEAWLADAVTYFCRTFQTLAELLDYEDGQHEHVDDVKAAVEIRQAEVNAVLAKVQAKQAKKRAEERKRLTVLSS